MFKELFLSVFVGIMVGFALFCRTRVALQQRFEHMIRDKYASRSMVAEKFPSVNDDSLDIESPSSTRTGHKFYKPAAFTDPLFNPKSAEVALLRSEFSQMFAVLNTLRDFILRDFINEWYQSGVSPDDTKFANHIKLALDGVFQILVKRISCVRWLTFIRDHVMHPLRYHDLIFSECTVSLTMTVVVSENA